MILIEIGSLFSGIGGLELGFKREGFTTKWFVEKDKYCQAVLNKNFPGIPIYEDITKVSWNELPKVDILIGGFPCQDISQAGKGVGISGERSGLWNYFKEAIRVLRPKYAVIENVPMLSNRGLNVVLANLAEAGYDAEWFIISAKSIGAPHKRERIFIIAYPCIQRQFHLRFPINSSETWKQTQSEITSKFVTYNWNERIQGFRQESLQGKQGFSWCENVRRVEDFKGRQDIPEPLFYGSRDGIPYWVDRIKSCGNAVVPQVAQFIARVIKESVEGEK